MSPKTTDHRESRAKAGQRRSPRPLPAELPPHLRRPPAEAGRRVATSDSRAGRRRAGGQQAVWQRGGWVPRFPRGLTPLWWAAVEALPALGSRLAVQLRLEVQPVPRWAPAGWGHPPAVQALAAWVAVPQRALHRQLARASCQRAVLRRDHLRAEVRGSPLDWAAQLRSPTRASLAVPPQRSSDYGHASASRLRCHTRRAGGTRRLMRRGPESENFSFYCEPTGIWRFHCACVGKPVSRTDLGHVGRIPQCFET